MGFGLKAQCPLGTAVDFTATDCTGSEVHLFDILDGGQYVLIDFFFTDCSGCNEIAPMMMQAYQAFGCNEHDVVFIEVDEGDSEQACLNWVNQYGIEFHTISGDAGGTDICSQYIIYSYPTVILIAPDRQIVIRDLWPLANLQNVVDALEAQGLEQHSCTDGLSESTSSLSLYPNPANECVTLNNESNGLVSIYNTLGQKVEEFYHEDNTLTINTSRYTNGVYIVRLGETTTRLVVRH